MSGVGPRYRILRRLGQGGMAEVFEAELAGELGFVRKVAIKRMLHDAAADPAAAGRFLDEARIASRLHHANIVAVTDVGLLDGLPFQVLELVDGINAHQLAQRAGGRLPVEIALAIAGEVARALDHAHRACDAAGVPLGVVHRDVKPANVLVSWAGDVKLGDFGIALARDREARTATGMVAGTLGFIAPEQRNRSEVDGRADVFALGLTLHALITGNNPLQDLAVEVAVLDGAPVPLDPDLPAEVRELIARAVAPARLDRLHAGELADAIAARLGRDARGQLRAFLDQTAARSRRPRAGALDQLLGIEVVLDASSADVVAHYHTVAKQAGSDAKTAVARASGDARTAVAGAAVVNAERAAAADPARGAVVGARAAAARAGDDARVAVPGAGAQEVGEAPHAVRGPRRRALPIVASVLGVAALGGGVWKLAGGGESDQTAGSGVVVVATAGSDDAHVAVATPDAGTVDLPVDAFEPPHDAEAPIDAPSRRRATPKHDAGRSGSAATAPAPVEPGWLQVYGDALIGAKVLVDGGKYTVFVPNRLEIPRGSHRVVVELRDGTRLPAKQVEITGFHSSASPLRITW